MTIPKGKIIYRLDDIHSVAKLLIAAHLQRKFIVYLHGDLGSGKTTLVGVILKELGLPANVPVTSPTYTYVQVYEIGARKFAHLDLYRLPVVTEEDFLGLLPHYEEFDGLFIEWPERFVESFLQHKNWYLEHQDQGRVLVY